MLNRKQIGAMVQMDMVTDSLLKVGHIQTGNAFNRFFSHLCLFKLSKILGQLRTSKNIARD